VVKEKGKRKLRKVVTGDPDKRLRDHMREVPQVTSRKDSSLDEKAEVLEAEIKNECPTPFILFLLFKSQRFARVQLTQKVYRSAFAAKFSNL